MASTPTPVPPWAVACWADGINVYAEIPLKTGGGYYRYSQPFSDEGLRKLLHLLRDHEPKGPPISETHQSYRAEQREYATSKLRQLGLV